MARAVIYGLLAATLMQLASGYTLLGEHSFKAPYNQYNAEGGRVIDKWRVGGAASVYENYLRLTPDRQSKRGHIYNSAKVNADQWSTTIKFRISGQGKKLFGDGMAFWFTTEANYKEGELHGFTDMFTGFGIILDTYVNKEPGHVHKDILLISSDGSQSKKAAGEHGGGTDPNPVGCDADFRYWEGRQDFSVLQMSAVRITFKDEKVSVYVDARSNGEWKPCIQDATVAAPSGWWRKGAYMGLTASTGDLADNHDVISVQTGLEDEVAPEDTNTAIAMISTGREEIDTAIQTAATREAQKFQEKLNALQHSLEYQLAAVNDNIKATIKKIQDQEADNKRRIEELEKKFGTIIASEVEQSISNRIDKLERTVFSKVDSKLAKELMPNVQTQLDSSSKASWVQFLILIAVILAFAGYFSMSFRTVNKKLRGEHLP